MPAPTIRSKEIRDLGPRGDTVSRITNTIKAVSLDPPQHIAENSIKLEWWNTLCTDLAGRQILSPSYRMSLIVLVDNIADYHEYKTMLDGSGPLIPVMTKDGSAVLKYVENPLFNMVKRIELMINKLCEKFGLNPRDAVYTCNPDILEKGAINAEPTNKTKNITYFQ